MTSAAPLRDVRLLHDQRVPLRDGISLSADVYLPLYQQPAAAFAVLARTAGDGQPLAAAIRQTIAKLDPTAPVFQIETGEQLVGRQTSSVRFMGTLLGAFAFVALESAIS